MKEGGKQEDPTTFRYSSNGLMMFSQTGIIAVRRLRGTARANMHAEIQLEPPSVQYPWRLHSVLFTRGNSCGWQSKRQIQFRRREEETSSAASPLRGPIDEFRDRPSTSAPSFFSLSLSLSLSPFDSMSECRPPALDEEAKRERERGRERERERERGRWGRGKKKSRRHERLDNERRSRAMIEGESANGCAKTIHGAQTDLRIGDLAQRADD